MKSYHLLKRILIHNYYGNLLMLFPDANTLAGFSLWVLIFFAFICGRYFLISGIFYAVFYYWFPEKWKKNKINQQSYKKGQLKKEMYWSTLSAIIFAITGAASVWLWQAGHLKIYVVAGLYGLWYLPVSLIIYMIFQETYYYWIHRWMHIPAIFKIVHKVHHDSKISSPFTAFSFHPFEALLQAVFLPVVLLIIPIQLYALIFLLFIMSISSVINHLDIELYPASSQGFFAKWVIGATHHSLHHKQYKYNFGLYFTFWDVIKKTESPYFKELFRKVSGK